MADREVTLTIKVKGDKDVAAAEASLKRLERAANDVGKPAAGGGPRDGATAAAAKRLGISYEEMEAKVRSATGATKEASVAIAETGQVAAASSGRLAGMGAAAGTAAAAIAAAIAAIVVIIVATAAAAYKLAQTIFELTKAFAENAIEVRNISEETGLAIDTIQALQHETKAQGRSFDVLAAAAKNLRDQIGKAAAGSEEARKALNLLGIDGKRSLADIDGAFKTALETIANAKDPVEQVRLAIAAFGPDGAAKAIPIIRQFGGDIDGWKKRLGELGLITGKGIKEAEELNRAYADLQKVFKDFTNIIGETFGPTVTRVLQSITDLFSRNKDTIKGWAEKAAEGVDDVIRKIERLANLIQERPYLLALLGVPGAVPLGLSLNQLTPLGDDGKPKFYTPTDRSTIEGRPAATPIDPAVIAAQLAELEKQREEMAKRAKSDLDAQIEYAKLSTQILGTNLDKVFAELKKKLDESGNIEAFQRGVDQLTTKYTKQITALDTILQNLENRKADLDKLTPKQRQVLELQQRQRNEQFGAANTKIFDQANKIVEDAQKKSSDKYLKDLEVTMNRAVELYDAASRTRILNAERDRNLTIISERQAIDLINQIELDVLNNRKAELQKYLAAVSDNADKRAEIEHRLAVLDEQITQQNVKNSDRRSDAAKREREIKNEIARRAKDFLQSLEDEYDAVLRNNRPLSRYEETLRAIERNLVTLSPAEQQRALDLAAQADAVEELNRQHAELKEFFRESLTYVFEGDFRGLIESFRRRFVDSFVESISNFLATEILGFDPNATDNPVAKPIVGKLDITNKLLGQIVKATGQMPAAGGLGSLGGILSSIFNTGGSGVGPGGTPYFNPGGGGFGGGNRLPTITLPNGEEAVQVSGGGGFLSRLTGPGGIFGSEGFGNNVGTYGAVGAGAGLLGGLIGGRVGGVISSVGSGIAIGAQIGSIIPGVGTAIGAVVGGIAGLFAGLFGGDPKRKRDKNEKIPALNKGFTEAFAELRKILEDVRFLRADPDEAISRANEVRAQIAGGFGIQFESKKYRKQAQSTIKSKLAEADSIINEIKAAAEIARGAADRRQRILPEFAAGTYFADYFKPNGLLPGMFDGRDNILAMISRGEMVLNPKQQTRVRSLAGFDVFAGAGIPNYPNASPSPKLATGGIAGAGVQMTPVVNVQPVIHVEGVTFERGAKAWIESSDGRRTLVEVVKEERKLRKL